MLDLKSLSNSLSDLITVRRAAGLLDLSTHRVAQFVDDGTLPSVRPPCGDILIPRRDVEALLAKREAGRVS